MTLIPNHFNFFAKLDLLIDLQKYAIARKRKSREKKPKNVITILITASIQGSMVFIKPKTKIGYQSDDISMILIIKVC